jgi:site-specific DNA recombinase
VARQLAECRKLAEARGWDNDTSASNGKIRKGFERVMSLIEGREVDVVIVWAVDRLVRKLADLERVIDTCLSSGVKLATVSGDLDLSTDQGRLVGRILASVARGEVERKSARQKLAAQQAAAAGKRWTGCPRPFGYADDHVTPEPAEADAIRWAADALLGGSTVSGVAREWGRRGLVTAQHRKPFGDADGRIALSSRQSVLAIMRNPRLAGLNAYKGEITGPGDWQPILPEETWRAVLALLDDPARKPPRGVRTLLGGLARCRCGNTCLGSQNALGQPVYRCDPVHRGDRPGPHMQQRITQVDEFVVAMITGRLARPDVADLITPPATGDTAALRTEAASIRANLDELAADRALGIVSRSQMIAATERGNAHLSEIAARLAESASVSALAPFTAAQNARAVWDSLDLARQRAVIDALATLTIHPAGRGARTFDPATVEIGWRQP